MTEKTFTSLFKQFNCSLVWFAQKIVGDKATAEDIVINVFSNIWEKQIDFVSELASRNMLYQAVLRKCLDIKKTSRRRKAHHQHMIFMIDGISDDFADNLIIEAELMRMIKEKINSLPKQRRKIFDLLFMDGHSPDQVAMMLDISVNTVRVQKMRIENEFAFLKKNKVFHSR